MKYKEVAKILKVSRVTVHNYIKSGKIRYNRINSRLIDYNEDDVYKAAGVEMPRKCVIYARVSTSKQKTSLDNQVELLTNYCISNGYTIDAVYKDIASGLHFDRCNFKNLLFQVIEHHIKTVVITNKDRLTRVSFDMWKELFASFNCRIIIANESCTGTDNDEKEIFSDIISMLHCFAMKMYSKRRKMRLNMVKENLEAENAITE